MIIASGFNIYPREIEEVLYEHERDLGMCRCRQYPILRGETVKAYIVLKEGKSVTEEELNTFCRESFGLIQSPASI